MRMTRVQQELVNDHLYLVDEVLAFRVKRIYGCPDYDMEDLRQTGRLGLCLASMRYDGVRPFPAFAREVIWNQLLDYFKQLKRKPQIIPLETPDPEEQSQLDVLADGCDVADLAENAWNRDNLIKLAQCRAGVAQKGIQAMVYKLDGLTGADVAKIYGVKPNQVSAWVSRAKKYLQTDGQFLKLVS